MEEEFADDFEGTYDSDELAPKPINEANTEEEKTYDNTLDNTESTDFLEFYFNSIDLISTDILEYNNYKGKSSKATDVLFLPKDLFTRIEQLAQSLLETFSIDQALIIQVFERLMIELNNSATEFMANKFYENAKRIMNFCVDILTNHKINVSFVVQKNPSVLINSYNNLATCLIRQYKSCPEKYRRNLEEENALGLLKKAKELILSKKERTGLPTNQLNFSKLYNAKKQNEKALEYATMAVNDLQNLEIGEITANGDVSKSTNDGEISVRKQQLRLLALALYTVGEEEMHLKNINNALNAFKKAKNTLKKFFGEKDSTFKKYNDTYEKISKRVLNNKTPKQMSNNPKMAVRASSKGKRVSLKDEESVTVDLHNISKNGKLKPISPNCINSMSDLSSVDNTVKKGILKPPKPRNFNNRTSENSQNRTYENHNNSRLNETNNKSRISGNTPINEVLCESDDEIYEQVNMQKNMLDFFDNMVQHVGPKHRINRQIEKDVQKYRNELQVKRKKNFITTKKSRDESPQHVYSDFKGTNNSLDLDTANEDSIKFNEPKFGSHQQIRNDSKVVKQEMQKTIEELKVEAERQKLMSQESERERLKEEVEKEKLKLEVERLKQEEKAKQLNEQIAQEKKRAEIEEQEKLKLIEQQEEEKRRMGQEHEEKLRTELDNMRNKFQEEMKQKFEEQQKELDKIRREQLEEMARIDRENTEKRKEELERINRENEEKDKKDQEEKDRLRKEELERTKREQDLKERLIALEEEKSKKWLNEESERQIKKQEEERLRKAEEEERLRKEEEERLRKEQEEERLRTEEEEERLRKEEEEERLRKEEEEEKYQREIKVQEEMMQKQEEERLKSEEEERLKKEEEDRIRIEEEDRIRIEEIEERLRKEEEERVKREEEESLRKQEEERLKLEEDENLRKQEEEERLKKEQEEEEHRLKEEEYEKEQNEQEEMMKRQEEERIKKEEDERIQKEIEERLEKAEEERLEKEEEEKLKAEEEEKLKAEEEEKLKAEEEEKLKAEEEEKLKAEEEEKLKAEEEEKLKAEEDRLEKEQEEEERIKKEESEKSRQEDEEKVKQEQEHKMKHEQEEVIKLEEEDNLFDENFDDFEDSLQSLGNSPFKKQKDEQKPGEETEKEDAENVDLTMIPVFENEPEPEVKGDQLLPGMPEEKGSSGDFDFTNENPDEPKSKDSSNSDLRLHSKRSELKSNLSDIFEEAENSLDNLPISRASKNSIAKSEFLKDTPKHNQSKFEETPKSPRNQSKNEESLKTDFFKESTINKNSISPFESNKDTSTEANKKLHDSPEKKFKVSSENLIKKCNLNKASNNSNDDFYDDFMVEDDEFEQKNNNSVKNAQKSSSGLSQSELYNKSKVATEVNDFDDLDEMEEL